MRERLRPARRTDGIFGDQGGITVEASLVMPIFIFAVLFLIAVVRMAAVQMALQDTAVHAVRLAASHMHPAALAAASASVSADAPDDAREKPAAAPLGEIGSIAAEWAGELPSPAGPLLQAVLTGDWDPIADAAAARIGEAVFLPSIRRLAAESMLDPARIRLERLGLPDLTGGEDAYLRLRLAYDFPLAFPFTASSVKLTADAAARAWVSDPVPAGSRSTGSGDEPEGIVILSIEPSPLRPGRKAKVTAAGKPNARMHLEVKYKSGSSRAKNVGEAQADANGMVSWEWHVSGNTTPGTWELTVTSEDGVSVSRHFMVRKQGT